IQQPLIVPERASMLWKVVPTSGNADPFRSSGEAFSSQAVNHSECFFQLNRIQADNTSCDYKSGVLTTVNSR
ncbi:hypothetical protein EVAR_72263_1, partial [Eumeta japonica]